ncbi:MAG: hypothetical protein ACRDAP_01270, partial [Shewanella sp.]
DFANTPKIEFTGIAVYLFRLFHYWKKRAHVNLCVRVLKLCFSVKKLQLYSNGLYTICKTQSYGFFMTHL